MTPARDRGGFAGLLTVAARVLDQVGELPPLTVTCCPAEQVLQPLVLTPASVGMEEGDQAALVRSVASRMGWRVNHLREIAEGWSSTGTVDGVRVQAIAAPFRSGISEPPARTTGVTTAEHAELLRALVDWSASLPEEVKALEVQEDLDGAGRFTARLVLSAGADASRISEVVMPLPDDGWSGVRGLGVLPTGHALTISVGM